MKKILTLIIVTISLLMLCGCSSNKSKDIEIEKYPINVAFTSDWDVRSYNGYECTDYSTVKNDDGTYTVSFVFTQLP